MSSLQKLQQIIKDHQKSQGEDFAIERVLPDVISDDIFGTLMLATDPDPANEMYRVLKSDEVLIEGVEETIERGPEFFQIAGLALRNEASANLYVTVNITDDEGLENITVVHILAYAWFIYLDRGEDYRLLLSIIALLCAAGADAKLPVTDAKILMERRRNRARDSRKISPADVINQVGTPRSILAVMAASMNTENDELVSAGDYDVHLSDLMLKYIAIFTAFRGSLGDIYNTINVEQFTSGDLELTVPIRQEDREDAADLAMQIGEALDDPNHMGGGEGWEKLASCLNVHANKCAAKILASNTITIEQAENGFLEAIDAYNGKGVILMLDNGLVPRYNHVDRIIFVAAEKKSQNLPISAEILTGILIAMSERGVSLDNEQMREIGFVSESSFRELSVVELDPYWVRTCRVPGGHIRGDLRQLARELDLDPGMDKNGLCQELNNISSVTTESLSSASQRLRSTGINANGSTLGDIVKGRTLPSVPRDGDGNSLANGPSPSDGFFCANADQLGIDPSKVAKIDIHRVRDHSDGKTYCFKAVDYPTLLRTGVNQYTRAPLSIMDIEAIDAKYRTLRTLGLPLESTLIEDAIQKVKGPGNHHDYELYVRSQRDMFLKLINSEEIGMPTRYFLNEAEDGGFEIEEMEEILRNITNNNNIRLTPINNREHAIRTFAMTFMELLEEARSYFSTTKSTEETNFLIDDLISSVESMAKRVGI